MVALDGSIGSKKALQRAVLLAREANAPLHALAVADHLPRFPGTIAEVKLAQEEMDDYFTISDGRRPSRSGSSRPLLSTGTFGSDFRLSFAWH